MQNKSRIERIMDYSDYECREAFGCCAIVAMRLPNGKILVEKYAACDNFDYEYGVAVCYDRLRSAVAEMEGLEDV